jgi:hypothetical protein
MCTMGDFVWLAVESSSIGNESEFGAEVNSTD